MNSPINYICLLQREYSPIPGSRPHHRGVREELRALSSALINQCIIPNQGWPRLIGSGIHFELAPYIPMKKDKDKLHTYRFIP